MAENHNDDLDDFFAKKDKSNKKKGKSKTKGKMAISELMPSSTPTPPNESQDDVAKLSEQVLEAKLDYSTPDVSKDRKKSKKKKDRDGGDAGSKREEDEWNEVNDAVDYSGLRIATKNIAKEAADEAAENAARSEPEYDEDGQLIEKVKDETVWKMPESQSETREVEEPQAPTPVIVNMPNVSDSKYVPPSRRGGAAAGTPDLAPISIRRPVRKKIAPNMNSQEDFPSLGAAPAPVDYDVSKFERVRGGGSSQQSHAPSGPSRLETSNKFSALERR